MPYFLFTRQNTKTKCLLAVRGFAPAIFGGQSNFSDRGALARRRNASRALPRGNLFICLTFIKVYHKTICYEIALALFVFQIPAIRTLLLLIFPRPAAHIAAPALPTKIFSNAPIASKPKTRRQSAGFSGRWPKSKTYFPLMARAMTISITAPSSATKKL